MSGGIGNRKKDVIIFVSNKKSSIGPNGIFLGLEFLMILLYVKIASLIELFPLLACVRKKRRANKLQLVARAFHTQRVAFVHVKKQLQGILFETNWLPNISN